MSENDPETSIPELLCAAIDLLEEVEGIARKLDTLVDKGWEAHEHGEDLPTGFDADFQVVVESYFDAARRAGR